MIVTAIEDFGKGKQKVYLDGQLAFVLYRGELSRCHIEENRELSEENYKKIMEEILWKRIRERCLYLLKSMDRTEYQIRTKLHQSFYPEELIDRAMDWLKKLHYLDDARYAESYLRSQGEKRSRFQLQQDLVRKGVDKVLIKEAMDEMEECDEDVMIQKWIEKKRVDLNNCTPKDRQKLYGFLIRKGFSPSKVAQAIRGYEDFGT